jgi:hypothetical protein
MSMGTNMPSEQEIEKARAQRYERSDVQPSSLLKYGFWLAVVIFFSILGMRWLFGYFSKTQSLGPPPSPFASSNFRVLPPSPRLQPAPVTDLRNYRDAQQQELNSYGWIDPHNGVVRIPIDRAMDLLLQRGLPVRPGGAPVSPAAGAAESASPTAPKAERTGGDSASPSPRPQ